MPAGTVFNPWKRDPEGDRNLLARATVWPLCRSRILHIPGRPGPRRTSICWPPHPESGVLGSGAPAFRPSAPCLFLAAPFSLAARLVISTANLEGLVDAHLTRWVSLRRWMWQVVFSGHGPFACSVAASQARLAAAEAPVF